MWEPLRTGRRGLRRSEGLGGMHVRDAKALLGLPPEATLSQVRQPWAAALPVLVRPVNSLAPSSSAGTQRARRSRTPTRRRHWNVTRTDPRQLTSWRPRGTSRRQVMAVVCRCERACLGVWVRMNALAATGFRSSPD